MTCSKPTIRLLLIESRGSAHLCPTVLEPDLQRKERDDQHRKKENLSDEKKAKRSATATTLSNAVSGTHLYSALRQVDLLSQFLPGIHVWILAECERLLKYVQLIGCERGPVAAMFLSWVILIAVAVQVRICAGRVQVVV